jgi:hypothetical protein
MTEVSSNALEDVAHEGDISVIVLESFWVIVGSDATAMLKLDNAATLVTAA